MLSVFSLCFFTTVNAQGDFCSGAVAITPGTSTCSYQGGTSENATESQATCSVGGNADDDVWYQFVANSTEMHIKVNPSDNYDPVIQLFSGTCAGLASVVCEDLFGDGVTEEIIATGLTNGNTYFIRVYDYGLGSGSDDFSICVFGIPSAANDVACSAFALPTVTPSCNMATYTTSGATNSGVPAPGTCGTVGYAGGDVWFSVVVPANGILEISTIAGVVADGAIALYSGACGALALISCNDDFSATNFMPYLYQTGLTPGETVFIRFWEYDNDNPGTFSICVSSPLNDNCASASLICDFNGYGGITSAQYTEDRPDNMYGNNELPDGTNQLDGTCTGGVFGGITCDVDIDNNSWITFVANGPTAILDIEVEYCLDGNGMQMQVFSGTGCTNFVAVSNFLETTSSQTLTATGLTVGETYYIMIDGFAGDVCNYTITAQSGVQVVDITSSAGTSVCPGQSTELTVETAGATVSYDWSAAPGGNFGTGLQTENVNVTTTTVYTVTVTGFCDASETASITVTPDKTVTADFYATTSPGFVPISPFPASLSCEADEIALWAEDSATVGGYITPALRFVFVTDNFAVVDNTTLTIYEDGVIIYNQSPLSDNTILTVYGEYLSPTSLYTFDLCETFGDGGVTWEVYDENTGLQLGNGTMASGNPCETFGPFSPAGITNWSVVPATAALTTTDFGLAFFDPNIAGIGSYDITYSWDNTVGCSDTETKTITVTNPHVANWNPPAPVCANSGIIDLTALIDGTATSTTGTWSGTGVSGSGFDPTGLSGNIAVTYTVGSGSGCEDVVTHDITVNTVPAVFSTTVTQCDNGTGAVSFNLSNENAVVNGGTGNTVNWFTDAAATSGIATPASFSSGTNTVYAVVTDGNSCTDTTNVDLVLNPQPATSTATMSECDDGTGDVLFDLTTMDNTVNTGIGANTVSWFTDAAATSSIAAPAAFNSGTATVFAVITDAGTSCTDTVSASLTLLSQPIANNLTPSICEDALGSGSAAGIDLTSNEPNINGGGGINFSWFDDALLTTPTATPTTTTVNNGDDFFVSVSDANGCSDTATVAYSVTGTIALNDPNAEYCEDDAGLGTVSGVDLTTHNTAIYTGGGTETFIWYEDAAMTVPVVTPSNVTLTSGSYDTFTISVTDGNCSNNITISFIINVSPPTSTASAELCDENPGFTEDATFNLTTLDNTVNTGNGNGVSWFQDIAALIPVPAPGSFNTTTTTVYAVVTDGNSCTDTVNADLIVNPLPSVTVSKNDVSCFGFSDGDATATASGGTSGFTYLWSANASSQTIPAATGLTQGNYSITITDSKTCTTTGNTTISQPSSLSITNITINDPLCNGGTDGFINISITGGTTDYTYLWNTSATTQNLSGLSQGNYALTLTDANSCSVTNAVTLTEPTLLTLTTSQTNVSCNGLSDGTGTAEGLGGTGALTYTWSTGGNGTGASDTEPGLAANTYTVTLTDDNFCSASAALTITEPGLLSISEAITDVNCFGQSTGEINTVISGGNPPYGYLWNSGQTSSSVSGIAAGNYSLTVNDAVTPTACSASMSFTISEPSQLTVNATITDISCSGGSSGMIETAVSGGTSAYSFLWSDGSTTQKITGLSPGNFDLTVVDAFSCYATDTYTVGGSATSLSVTTTVNDVTCNGLSDGSATIIPLGGTSPYTYTWETGATTQTLSGVPAGSYNYSVSDFNGCEAAGEIPAISSCINIRRILVDACIGGGTVESEEEMVFFQTGSTALDISNLTVTWPPPTNVSFFWRNTCSNPAWISNVNATITGGGTVLEPPGGIIPPNSNVILVTSSAPVTSSMAFSNLETTLYVIFQCAGNNSAHFANYSTSGTITRILTMDFGSGCSQTVTYDKNLLINQSGNPGAQDGAIVSYESDGSTLYTNNACVAPFDTLPPLSVIINEPAVLSTTVTSNNISCFGFSDGEASASVSGGTSPYDYLWSEGSVSPLISGLDAGVFNATISDVNLCSVTASLTITTPMALTMSVSQTDISCNGNSDGTIDAIVSGGTTPYVYIWNTGASTSSVSGLIADVYSLTVADANNCEEYAQITLTEPTQISATHTPTNVSCAGNSDGAISTTVSGGVSPYSYLWNNNSTSDAISGLSPGNYDLTVTDDNSCENYLQITVTINSTAITVTPSSTSVSCNGFSDGSVSVDITGGVSPYTYLWNNDLTTSSLSGLPSGIYDLTVTDAITPTGCLAFTSITLSEPLPLSATPSGSTSCGGNSDGTATVLSTGGTTPYTYLWNNTQTTAAINNLSAAIYSVTVTDANSCTRIVSTTVTSIPLPTANPIEDTTCETIFGTLTATGIDLTSYEDSINGNSGISYVWLESDQITGISSPANVSITGNDVYYAVISDGVCQNIASVSITVVGGASVTVSGGGNVCTDESNSVDVIFTFAGSAPYTFTYFTGNDSVTVSNYNQNSYQITANTSNSGAYYISSITSGAGCVNNQTSNMVSVSSIGPVADFIPDVTSGDPPLQVNFINYSTNTGFENYGWTFGTGATSNDFSPSYTYNAQGDYTVTLVVEDITGCTDSTTYQFINVGDGSILIIPGIFTPNNDGVNDVFSVNGINIISIIGNIYNRWGESIYMIDRVGQGWDGRTFAGQLVPDGVYFYTFVAEGADGIKYEKTGNVTVIR